MKTNKLSRDNKGPPVNLHHGRVMYESHIHTHTFSSQTPTGNADTLETHNEALAVFYAGQRSSPIQDRRPFDAQIDSACSPPHTSAMFDRLKRQVSSIGLPPRCAATFKLSLVVSLGESSRSAWAQDARPCSSLSQTPRTIRPGGPRGSPSRARHLGLAYAPDGAVRSPMHR